MIVDGTGLHHRAAGAAAQPPTPPGRETASPRRQALILAAILLPMLVAAIGVTIWMSNRIGDVPMDGNGYAALIIGVTVTAALGMALMGLLFYSNRHGYDEGATRREPPTDERR